MDRCVYMELQPGDKLEIRTCEGKQVFRFRQDPVPGKKYIWKNSPRHYRTFRERRAYADREMAAYARAGRAQELSVVFEVCRVSQRSWKSHRKHQWK